MVAQETRRSYSDMASSIQPPTEMVKEYPISSMLVVFGLGLGVGVLLSQALAEPLERSWHEPSMTERWGRSMYDAMSNAVPEAVSRRWSS